MKKAFIVFTLLSCAFVAHAQKYLGGDISLLTKYEEKGAVYKDKDGNTISDVLTFLKSQGMNSMRLRLFVDPDQASSEDQAEGVCQDLDYVKVLGKRIKDAGLSLLLDLHYSDTWTDPGQHSTPSSWTGTTAAELAASLYDYTKEVLTTMKNYGAEPDFVQVGNEVTYGMLWETGHCYPAGSAPSGGSWDNFALYLEKGVAACREVCPNAKVVIHVEMSNSGGNVSPFFQTLSNYNIDYDIIGLSYYPYYHGNIATLESVISSLESTYPTKKIQLVELGYPHAYYPSDCSYDYTSTYPATEEGQQNFTTDLITMLLKHRRVNGLYWWWPEANEYGIDWTNAVTSSWNNNGLWDNSTGVAQSALYELEEFLTETEDLTDGLTIGARFINSLGWDPVYCYANTWDSSTETETLFSGSWPGTAMTADGTEEIDGTSYNVFSWTYTGAAVSSIDGVPASIQFDDNVWESESAKPSHQSYQAPFVNGATYRHYNAGSWYATEIYSLDIPDGAGKTDHSTDFYCCGTGDWTIGTVNYLRNFTSGQKTTICLPFSLTEDEAAAAGKFYTLSSLEDGIVTFTPVTTVTAYTPYVFVATSTSQPFTNLYQKTLPATSLVDVTADGVTMSGVMKRTTLTGTSDNHIFGYRESDGKFVRVATGYINPFRAYLIVPASVSGASNVLNVNLDDVSTGIEKTEVKSNDDSATYDLQGRRQHKSAKGIFIRNGKKYIAK